MELLFFSFYFSIKKNCFCLNWSKIDENMRAQMALDWIAKEQQQPGVISFELAKANQEIERARLSGQELRFFKEKRDILLLASFQFETEIISFNWNYFSKKRKKEQKIYLIRKFYRFFFLLMRFIINELNVYILERQGIK